MPKTIPPTKAINRGRNKDSRRLNPKVNPITITHIITTPNNTAQVILNASFKLSPLLLYFDLPSTNKLKYYLDLYLKKNLNHNPQM